jgi:hypothetical protein
MKEEGHAAGGCAVDARYEYNQHHGEAVDLLHQSRMPRPEALFKCGLVKVQPHRVLPASESGATVPFKRLLWRLHCLLSLIPGVIVIRGKVVIPLIVAAIGRVPP